MNAGEQPLLKIAYHVIFMINKLHLVWVPNFIAWGIYFLSGAKFSWNEENDTCFNVECVLLGRNFDFLGGYLLVTWWLLFVTTCYCPFPLSVWIFITSLFGYFIPSHVTTFPFAMVRIPHFFIPNFHSNISPKEMNSSHKCITLIFTLGKQLQLIHEQQMIQLVLLISQFVACFYLSRYHPQRCHTQNKQTTVATGCLSEISLSSHQPP